MEYFREAALESFQVAGLKAFASEFKLPKSGKKADLVERMVQKLYAAYLRRDAASFNAMINFARKIKQTSRFFWLDYQEPGMKERFLAASKAKAYTHNHFHTIWNLFRFMPKGVIQGLAPFKIVQSISDPIFFPALPVAELDILTLPVQFNKANLRHGQMMVLLVFKIYDAPNLPDNPDPRAIRFRLSKGRRATFHLGQMDFLERPRGQYYYPLPEYGFQSERVNTLIIPQVQRSLVPTWLHMALSDFVALLCAIICDWKGSGTSCAGIEPNLGASQVNL